MRFVRLKMEHFAGVASGQVELGPGLNVLYGPNELGKSTMAEAIRGALLLQHNSSAHQPWVRWNSDTCPDVELVFQTEPQRFWRVRKTFGPGSMGRATLDESKDGVNFANLAKGRRVDAEIRKLLNWGIPEPGGSGGPKGLPETFLTAVLLPHQDNVTDVFQRQLGDDYDESGRRLLTKALQALATDPVFAKVLADAQAKVDEAFTTTGRKRGDKASPWKKINEDIKQTQERVQLSKEAEATSESVRLKISSLHKQLVDETDQCDALKSTVASRQEWFKTKCELEDQSEKAQAELTRVQGIHSDFNALVASEGTLRKQVEDLNKQVDQASAAVEAADAGVKVAEKAVSTASNEQSAAQRQIKVHTLENQLLQLAAKEKTATGDLEKAQRAKELSAQIEMLTREIAEASERLDESRNKLKAIRGQITLLEGLEVWQHKQETLALLQQAEAAQAEIAALRTDNQTKQTELDEIQERLQATQLPSQTELAEFKKLHGDLRVAQARLDVGLSFEITPSKPLDVKVSCDNQPPTEHQLATETKKLEADRLLELTIDDVADIVVRGGKPEAREELDKLEARWKQQIEPVMHAAGVTTLEELESARDATDEDVQRVRDLKQDVKWNNDQIELKTADADKVSSLQRKVDELADKLSEYDKKAVAEQAKLLDSHPMQERGRAIRTLLDQQKEELRDLSVGASGDEANLKNQQQELAAARKKMQELEAALSEPWKEVLASSQSQLQTVSQERTTLEAQLETLQTEGETELANAQKQLDTATSKRDKAKMDEKTITSQRTAALESLNKCRGEVNAERKLFEASDLDAVAAEVEQLNTQISKLGAPDPPVTAASLESDQILLGKKQAAVRELQTQIHNQEGALQHVGGDVARERHAAYAEALTQKYSQESEMALDYDAWKLLLQTLREVENDEAAHLGQAIMEPVAKRFGELTGGRYGNMNLGPALETQGIVALGEARGVDRLSVGTREQLSTILRLSLAEQLGSVLLLDDQLAQSDPKRMEWFRNMFRASGEKTQIIVLTCRPSDYLLPEELVAAEKYVDSSVGPIRAANLELLVTS